MQRLKEFKNSFANKPENVNVSIIETLNETHYKQLYSETETENRTTWTMDKIIKNKKDSLGQTNEIAKKTGPKFNIMNIGMGSGKTAQTVILFIKG